MGHTGNDRDTVAVNDPNVMKGVALGMADGHIHQADVLLSTPWRRYSLARGGGTELGLERALRHMRSANGWLISAAEAIVTR